MPAYSSLNKTLLLICKSYGFKPQIAIYCDDPYYVREYVAADLGITLYPELSWRGMFSEDVVFLKLKNESITRGTYVFWRNTKDLSYAAKMFKERLIQKFNNESSRLKGY